MNETNQEENRLHCEPNNALSIHNNDVSRTQENIFKFVKFGYKEASCKEVIKQENNEG